jgi:hypothetical protein
VPRVSSTREEEQPEHQPYEGYDQENGPQEEADRFHGRTVARKGPVALVGNLITLTPTFWTLVQNK